MIQRNEVITLDDMNQFILQQLLKNVQPDNELIVAKWNGTFDMSIPNTHSCPINGTTNWWGTKDAPKGYPGFAGRLWLVYKYSPSGFGRELAKDSSIHPGSGGSGYYDLANHLCDYDKEYPLSWYCKIFIDDFPKLELLTTQTHNQFTYDITQKEIN